MFLYTLVALKETLVKQERDVIHGLRAEREVDKNRLNEANDLLIRERLLIKDLQNMLNKDKTRLSVLEVALEKERTQNAVLQ